jgi:hypothetical protein
MYLKFLTPLTPSVEKLVHFMSSSNFINQEICHNSMAVHLTRSDSAGLSRSAI